MAIKLPSKPDPDRSGAGQSGLPTEPAKTANIHPATLLSLAPAIAAGVALRLLPVDGDFPAGDGGMFYQMVQVLVGHHFLLPATFTFNGSRLPFAYPPLGFYVVGLIHVVTGLSILDLMRIIPFVVSGLSLGAFCLLARALLNSRLAFIASVYVFALAPDSFRWEIKGGGITRAFGELFALLALRELILLYRSRHPLRVLTTGLALAAVLLSHPEWTEFTLLSVAILWIFLGRNRQSLVRTVMVIAVGVLISTPWWLSVLSRHGTTPFVNVLTNNSAALPWYDGLLNLASLHLTDQIGFPLATALALVGIWVCLVRREWLLPAWLLGVAAVQTRGTIDKESIIIALLAGLGVSGLASLDMPVSWQQLRPALSLVFAALIALYATGAGALSASLLIARLTPGQRAAMGWVAAHTPRRAQFAVITGSASDADAISEWFPALTGRTSLDTVQGSEWLPHQFAPRYQRYVALQKCASRASSCLRQWTSASGMRTRYVVVSKQPTQESGSRQDCCWTLRYALDHDNRYQRIFSNPAVAVYRRK